MQAHVLQHVAFEGPGAIVPWLLATGYEVGVTRFDLDEALPEVSGVDFLVVMGGPMSVNDEARHPWLSAELDFIQRSLRNGTRILGVCLGAQLLAKAAGAAVYPNAGPEIGWFPIEPVDSGRVGDRVVDVFRFPSTSDVFHWHGETFDLPAGAAHLARSSACEHQAFQLGTSAVGLPFHLETTPDLVDGLIEHGRHELVAQRWVQDESHRVTADGADGRHPRPEHRERPEIGIQRRQKPAVVRQHRRHDARARSNLEHVGAQVPFPDGPVEEGLPHDGGPVSGPAVPLMQAVHGRIAVVDSRWKTAIGPGASVTMSAM